MLLDSGVDPMVFNGTLDPILSNFAVLMQQNVALMKDQHFSTTLWNSIWVHHKSLVELSFMCRAFGEVSLQWQCNVPYWLSKNWGCLTILAACQCVVIWKRFYKSFTITFTNIGQTSWQKGHIISAKLCWGQKKLIYMSNLNKFT